MKLLQIESTVTMYYNCYACKLRVRNRTKRRNGGKSEIHNSYNIMSEISIHTKIFVIMSVYAHVHVCMQPCMYMYMFFTCMFTIRRQSARCLDLLMEDRIDYINEMGHNLFSATIPGQINAKGNGSTAKANLQ